MTVAGLNYVFAGQMEVDEITGGAPCAGTRIAGLDAQRQPSENELAGARYQVAQSSGTGAGSVEERRKTRTARNQVEHDLLAELRRAGRPPRLQGMDQPPAVARLTLGQRIADAVAAVMGSWSFIIVQSAILFVWITANLIGAIRAGTPTRSFFSISRFRSRRPTPRQSS